MCVSLGIFVCTRCSGIMRDFSFRIKSISASTFTGDEVEALRRSGNEAARRLYLARWSADKRPMPQCGDVVNGKAWIREVLVDKRWYDAEGATQAQATRATPAPKPATTQVQDLFGGLFNSPPPAQNAPAAQQSQQQQSEGGTSWDSFAAAFDAGAHTASQAHASVATFAPPPSVAQQSYVRSAPSQPVPTPQQQQQPIQSQQSDLFGGLTVETPVQTQAAESMSTPAPVARTALEEDFWTVKPQVPPQQPQTSFPGMPEVPPQMHSMMIQAPGMQMPAMPPPQGMQMPGMQMPGMQMPGMQMPGMQMPGMQMPGMPSQQSMPPQGMKMPGAPPQGILPQGMQMPGMQIPGTQSQAAAAQAVHMPGMQMPGLPANPLQPPSAWQAAQQAPPEPVSAQPEEQDPFASFGAVTGIKPKVEQAVAPSAPVSIQPSSADLFGSMSTRETPEVAVKAPSVAQSIPAAPDQVTLQPEPTPVNLGPMVFPIPASQPQTSAIDAHQAMMFDDMKTQTSGEFSFAPVDSPQPSFSMPSPAQSQQPTTSAQPTAAASQYSADNPFAFI